MHQFLTFRGQFCVGLKCRTVKYWKAFDKSLKGIFQTIRLAALKLTTDCQVNLLISYFQSYAQDKPTSKTQKRVVRDMVFSTLAKS